MTFLHAERRDMLITSLIAMFVIVSVQSTPIPKTSPGSYNLTTLAPTHSTEKGSETPQSVPNWLVVLGIVVSSIGSIIGIIVAIYKLANKITTKEPNTPEQKNQEQTNATAVAINTNMSGDAASAVLKPAGDLKNPDKKNSEQNNPTPGAPDVVRSEQKNPENKNPEQNNPTPGAPDEAATEQKTPEQTNQVEKNATAVEQKNPEVKKPEQKHPTLDDHFEEKHFQTVAKHLGVNTALRVFNWLRGLSDDEISKIIRPNVASISVHEQTENVLKGWIKKEGDKATRQAIVDALGESELNLAKGNLEKYWKGKLHKKCVKEDADDIINEGELNWNDLKKMFLKLLLKMFFIDVHRGIQTLNVEDTVMEVFLAWVKKSKPKIRELMYALKKAEDLNAAQEIAKEWEIPLKDIDKIKENDV